MNKSILAYAFCLVFVGGYAVAEPPTTREMKRVVAEPLAQNLSPGEPCVLLIETVHGSLSGYIDIALATAERYAAENGVDNVSLIYWPGVAKLPKDPLISVIAGKDIARQRFVAERGIAQCAATPDPTRVEASLRVAERMAAMHKARIVVIAEHLSSERADQLAALRRVAATTPVDIISCGDLGMTEELLRTLCSGRFALVGFGSVRNQSERSRE
jgi:hypothetical protein